MVFKFSTFILRSLKLFVYIWSTSNDGCYPVCPIVIGSDRIRVALTWHFFSSLCRYFNCTWSSTLILISDSKFPNKLWLTQWAWRCCILAITNNYIQSGVAKYVAFRDAPHPCLQKLAWLMPIILHVSILNWFWDEESVISAPLISYCI